MIYEQMFARLTRQEPELLARKTGRQMPESIPMAGHKNEPTPAP